MQISFGVRTQGFILIMVKMTDIRPFNFFPQTPENIFPVCKQRGQMERQSRVKLRGVFVLA